MLISLREETLKGRTKWGGGGGSDLVGYSNAIRITIVQGQTPLGAQLNLGTQPSYKAPKDLRTKMVETQRLTLG